MDIPLVTQPSTRTPCRSLAHLVYDMEIMKAGSHFGSRTVEVRFIPFIDKVGKVGYCLLSDARVSVHVARL